jgi:NDP-sugar pyrophosphorylase family protein
VGLGAVVTIGAKNQEWSLEQLGSPQPAGEEAFLDTPLECVEVVGRSALERLIERFVSIDVQRISVLVEASISARLPLFRSSYSNVTIHVVKDLDSAIRGEVTAYAQEGIGHAFVISASAYAETDLLDLFCFHRESRQAVTRAFDREGPLDLWAVDCAKAEPGHLETLLNSAGQDSAPKYFIREYVNRITHPRDLRKLATDILRRNCETGPSGKQVRPGVWLDDGADVHRRARIVAPAYIGCASKVKADALVTRFSDIERDCCIDSGTVIEDSSILTNTTIGICLDLCHALASGNKLWNLERDVAVELVDPKVMRFTTARRKVVAHITESLEVPEHAVSPKPEMPGTWQFDSNLFQE